MRLAIRFADKIVGVSIIAAVGALVFVLFMLAINQRWFARDFVFYTYFESAVGLSQNMPVQHVGFSIGQVRAFEPVSTPEGDIVRVRFVVFDTYIDRAREGSRVELIVSPIPVLGSQFLFHPGSGAEPLEEGAYIPSARGVDAVGSIIYDVGSLLSIVNEALEGTERTTLGRTLLNVEASAAALRQMIEGLSAGIGEGLESIMAQLEPTLAGIRTISEGLADPDGAVMSVLDGEGDVYAGLVASIEAIAGTLRNLEATTGYIPPQLPQIAALIIDLQMVLRTAEDVLVALTNNPLLRRGVPERVETGPGGTFARDMEF